MQTLTPIPIRIHSYYDDGEDARHFVFDFVNPAAVANFDKVAPGQFFMLNVAGAGAAPFTYTQLPDTNGRFCALVRNVGMLTSALFQKKPGDILGYQGPLGQGWPLADIKGKHILVIAGGCGLAPLAALIDTLISDNHGHQLALIYGSRTAALQILKQQRQRWQTEILLHETVDSPSPNMAQGSPLQHIDSVIERHGSPPDRVLCCGPEHMMHAVAGHFVKTGMAAEAIWLSIERRMHCGVGTCGHCYIADSYVCVDGPTYRFDVLRKLMKKTAAFPNQIALLDHC